MSLPSRVCAVALVAAALGGCQALGGGGGVMPETDIGPPPSMRGTAQVPQRGRVARVDADDPVQQTAPTRRLNLPNSGGGSQTRAAANEERRIRREDIEGESTSRTSSGGLAPQMSQGGGVGLGGKF